MNSEPSELKKPHIRRSGSRTGRHIKKQLVAVETPKIRPKFQKQDNFSEKSTETPSKDDFLQFLDSFLEERFKMTTVGSRGLDRFDDPIDSIPFSPRLEPYFTSEFEDINANKTILENIMNSSVDEDSRKGDFQFNQWEQKSSQETLEDCEIDCIKTHQVEQSVGVGRKLTKLIRRSLKRRSKKNNKSK